MLKYILLMIYTDLAQVSFDKSIISFCKDLQEESVDTADAHFD